MNKISAWTAVLLLLLIACNTKTDNKSIVTNESVNNEVALIFINGYVNFCNQKNLEKNSEKWIEGNELATGQFKMAYKEIIENAAKDDPEIGLGFDPIFDAQDYPEKGFEFLKSDNDGYITLKGIDWPDFTIVIKLKSVGDKLMVDGAGIINVPNDRQANR
jgi:hypothetical protein